MRIAFWCTLILVLVGCRSSVTPADFTTSEFISLDSIIESQKPLLLGKEVRKTVSIDGKSEQEMISLDSSFFDREWNFLGDFDLNKPGFVGGINVIQNDQSIRYEPKPDQSYLLDYLTFSFDSNNQLSAVEGAYTDQQAETIYESTRLFRFKFDEGVIRNYHISGYQISL